MLTTEQGAKTMFSKCALILIIPDANGILQPGSIAFVRGCFINPGEGARDLEVKCKRLQWRSIFIITQLRLVIDFFSFVGIHTISTTLLLSCMPIETIQTPNGFRKSCSSLGCSPTITKRLPSDMIGESTGLLSWMAKHFH